MGWYSQNDIEKLQSGMSIILRPKGNSMRPKICSGDDCLVVPIEENPEKGDIVFCRVKGKYYIHFVKAVQGDRFQIGNNKGGINGWIGRPAIFGKVTDIGR